MTNSKHPIHAAKDMGDLKMRVPDSKSYNAMMQAMGATVVAVDLSELYLALSQGVADGQDTPPTVVQSNKLYEVQKYVSKTDHVLTNAYSIINPQFYDGLPADQQQAILRVRRRGHALAAADHAGRRKTRPTTSSHRKAWWWTSPRMPTRSAPRPAASSPNSPTCSRPTWSPSPAAAAA